MPRLVLFALAALSALVACEPVSPSGDLLAPRPDAAPTAAATGEPTVPDGGYDLEADDRDTDVGGDVAPTDLASAMGIPLTGPITAAPTAAVVTTAVEVPAPAWPPPADAAAWGVWLVSTTPEAQPPIAVLGLPDGTTPSVHPGDLLPGPRVVVLAIGRDRVQIAQVTPEGDHAKVQTLMLSALHPGGTPTP